MILVLLELFVFRIYEDLMKDIEIYFCMVSKCIVIVYFWFNVSYEGVCGKILFGFNCRKILFWYMKIFVLFS